jgi:dTDP-6-deoxy-L-talose 4-dehydrogenase (NAD+)
MRILLTGATGFIGSKLCATLLKQEHEVIGVSRKAPSTCENSNSYRFVPYVMGDVFPKSVVDFSPEVLVHLAWSGIPDFSAEVCVENVKSQLDFMEATKCIPSLKKIVVAGTCREYGSKVGLCRESETLYPDNYFAWAKNALADYFRLVCAEREISLLWFRLFYVYGPGQRVGALIPTLIKAIRNNQPPEILNLMASNDYVYIDDIVEAFIKGIECRQSEGIVNLGSGHTVSVLDVVTLVAELGGALDMVPKNKKGEEALQGMVADINKAKSLLDWAPDTSLSEGIKKMFEVTA